jgi:hypothetical protein
LDSYKNTLREGVLREKEVINKTVFMESDKIIQEKRALINQIKGLMQTEQNNISKTFNLFNEVQAKWTDLPDSYSLEHQDPNQEYQKLVQEFYYNIKLHKELKDIELKKNLDKKLDVIERMKQLESLQNDLPALEMGLKNCEKTWNSIGATYSEKWEELKEKYYNTANHLYEILRSFRTQRKEDGEKSLQTKQEILRLMEELSKEYPTNKNKWVDLTNTFIKVEDHWKSIGFLDFIEDKKLNQRFKILYLNFFKHKKDFYKELIKDYKVNRELKNQVLEEVKVFKDAEIKDWSKALKDFDKLYKKFIQISPAGRKFDNALWDNFKKLADEFHDKRRAHLSGIENQEQQNVLLKRQLIEELNQYQLTDNSEQDINQLEDLSKNFGNLQTKDQVANIQFKASLDKKCSELNISEEDKEKIRFNLKITVLKGNEDPESAISKERDLYIKEYRKIEEDLAKLENNLGFFGKNARAIDGLFKDTIQKMDQLKARATFLKDQIRILEKTKKDIS